MLPKPFHGYHPDAEDRVALVTVEPSADRELFLVRVARGPGKRSLRQTSLLGPYSEEDVSGHFEDAVADLRAEGYWPAGVPALLHALDDDSPAVRGRAALRLGWRKVPEAVDKLLEKLPEAVDDSCPILDALGMIGDERAIAALRDYAQRKLLSRRRSAVEALRNISDEEGLAEARQRAQERLPDEVRAILDADTSGQIGAQAAALTDVFANLEPQQQALMIDTLYELATPAAVATVRHLLPQLTFAQPYLWRAIKSVYKRSMLRGDHVTFGLLTYLIEAQKSKGVMANVKSGYDGQMRQTSILGSKTYDYLRRAAWRYLRDVAAYRPEQYAVAAAEVLIHYTPEMVGERGMRRCYALHQILLGGSKRFRLDGRSMVFRLRSYKLKDAPQDAREEAYPELWDEQPQAYVRLLAAAKLPGVHQFAVAAIKARHGRIIREAKSGEILAMLDAPFEPTVELALGELDRRFDADNPDWALLQRMLDDDRPMARTLGQRWLRLTAHLWLRDVDRMIDFLGIRQPNIRALVAELVSGVLLDNPPLRQELAGRLLTILHSPEPEEGAYAGYADVVQHALAEEMLQRVSIAELANWIAQKSAAVQMMAAELLRQRADAVSELGLERLTALAQHELAAVRAAAHALLAAAVPQLRADPSVLFILVESDWDDTRRAAFDLLRGAIDVSVLGLDGLMGLLDSNRIDVQELGKELARKHLQELPADELVNRLMEHPHPNMRPFALDLAEKYLPESGALLEKVKPFCRAALLDVWPNRKVKQQAIKLLEARGVEDRQQAEVAAAILGDLVRLQGKSDFERTLEALVRIKLAHPEVQTTVELLPGGVE